MIGHISYVSHHSESILGVIELFVLCAFICRVGYFDTPSREIILYKEEV
jgi:hypothetical protein